MLHFPFDLDHGAITLVVFRSAAIFASSFVFEDGAAVLATVFVLDHLLSTQVAITALYLGVLASDVGLYGLGLAAHRLPWAKRLVSQARMDHVHQWIGGRLAFAIVMSRLLPWMLPPTFIACGFFRLPFRRFFVLVAVTAAAWTGVMLALMLNFGTAALSLGGILRWATIITACILLAVWRLWPGSPYTGSVTRAGMRSGSKKAVPRAAGTYSRSSVRTGWYTLERCYIRASLFGPVRSSSHRSDP